MVSPRSSYALIKQELLFFLRNNDVLTTTQRGVTTSSVSFSGNGATTAFDINASTVKNIRSITVDGTPKTFVTDYSVDTNAVSNTKCRITFTAAPASGTNNIVVSYDAGSEDKIYSDFPKTVLRIEDFPRIGFDITEETTEEVALGGSATNVRSELTIIAYATNDRDLDDYLQTIRDLVLDNKKSFKRIKFITPIQNGPLLPREGMKDQVFYRNSIYELIFDLEE